MKVYIASHDKALAQHAAKLVGVAGHEVVSRWHWEDEFKPTAEYPEGQRRQIAVMDHDDVCRCDALILLSGPEKYSGGKFVEAGTARGLGRPVIVVGRRENMLLWHPDVVCVESVQEAVEELSP